MSGGLRAKAPRNHLRLRFLTTWHSGQERSSAQRMQGGLWLAGVELDYQLLADARLGLLALR